MAMLSLMIVLLNYHSYTHSMLLLILISTSTSFHSNGRTKTIAYKEDMSMHITSMRGTIRLQGTSTSSASTGTTAMRLRNVNDEYLVQYTDGMFMCGNKYSSGVVGCMSVNDVESNSGWTIDGTDDGVRISIGERCLVRMSYDGRDDSLGYYLNVKRCNGNESDYAWMIIDKEDDSNGNDESGDGNSNNDNYNNGNGTTISNNGNVNTGNNGNGVQTWPYYPSGCCPCPY